MMVLHPSISKKLVSILACRWYNDIEVIMAAKTISCGNNTCVVTGMCFFVLYTIGIPIYVWISLLATLVKRSHSLAAAQEFCS